MYDPLSTEPGAMWRLALLSRSLLHLLQPSSPQSFLWYAGHVGLDIDQRSSVQHVDTTDEQLIPVTPKQLHDR